jgi:hypothetical protein
MLTKNLSDWRPAGRDTLQVADPGSPWTVHVTADRCELLGARLWELGLSRAAPAADVTLAGWAAGIAAAAIGLPEPLKVLEVDDLSQQALLRSATPTTQDGKLLYFEVLLKGTTAATLRRYQANLDATPRREQVPFVLTHETTGQLVAALTAHA